MPATQQHTALDAKQIRAQSRTGTFTGATSGHAYGMVQANLMILPAEAADEFRQFCERNPKPCPLIEVLQAGQTEPRCAPGADIRRDLPGYRIYRDGEFQEKVADIRAFWREDLVSFLIGCSFSFEEALLGGAVSLFGTSSLASTCRCTVLACSAHRPGASMARW